MANIYILNYLILGADTEINLSSYRLQNLEDQMDQSV